MYIVKTELPHDRALRKLRNRMKVSLPGKREKRIEEKKRRNFVGRMVDTVRMFRRPQGRGA